MSNFRCAKSVFAVAFLLAGLGLKAGSFTNGSFELINNHAAIPSGSYALLYPGDTWLTGWSVGGPGGGDIGVINGTIGGYNPYDGQQWISFNGGNTAPGGSLSQMFTTTVGQAYTVSFVAGESGSGNVSLTATAIASNNAVIASNYCVPTSGVWTLFQLGFTAVSTNTTLVFEDTSSQTIGVDLAMDAVSVTANVPSPTIITSPASQTANSWDSVNFTASASGASGVQWYFINSQGTNAISGANSTTLNVTASSTTAGRYYAVFSNDGGSTATSVATLAVVGIPFVNGGFETINHAAIPPGSCALLYPGDTWLTGWSVGGTGGGNICVDNGNSDGLSPYDGQQWIVFNGGNTAPGGILSQTFTTTVGQLYAVGFAVGEAGSGNVSLTATAVALDNSVVASNHCVPASGVWTLFHLNFTATSTNTTLVFADTSADTIAVDLAFDGVSVTPNLPVTAPVIVTSPVSQAVAAGGTAVFTASASGNPSSVQWYFINYLGTNAISGANSTTLNVTASSTTAGSYFAVFANTAGSAATGAATLAVLGLPFVNGGFETINHAAIASGSYALLYPGDTWLTGWSVGGPGGGDLGVINGPLAGYNPYDGQQWISFNGGNTAPGGSLSQTFTTVVGEIYGVSFVVGESGSGNVSLTATALALDNSLLVSNHCVPTSGVWTLFQLSFTAVSTNTTLLFTDSSATTFGADLEMDAVTVVAEPTSGLPVVTTSPASQTANSGATVSFSAVAAGSPSTIQWYLGTNAVTDAGGTSSPLVVTASDATAGNYTAVFSNSYGMATTVVAVLTVIDPPVITISPVSQVVTAGTQVTLTAAASGSAATVQWYVGTTAISGATSTNLSFLAVTGGTGNYTAKFSNAAGTATSTAATVTVIAGPFINGGFELINNHAAIPVNNSVALTPGSTWLTGWTVSGPVSADVSVQRGTGDGLNPYDGQQWIVLNAGNTMSGDSLSQTFLTTVGQPYAVTFAVGKAGTGNVSLTATAAAINGTLLASNYCVPTSGVWTVFGLGFTASTTNTTLTFKDTSSQTIAVDLALDAVTVVSPPVIVTSPLSQTNLVGTPVTFTASASGSPATVQWFQGINPILNATNTTLSFTVNAGSGGNYTAVFTNAAGSATTAVAVLTVDIPVYLTQQPQSLTTNVGATVTFTGGAGGTAPLSFQWQFDGTNISGATDASLVLTNAQPANAGSYSLVVANSYGTNTSTNAVLTFISTLQVASGSGAAAGTATVPVTAVPVTVPVNLLAIGSENAVGFNLDYDTNLLTYAGVALGNGAPGGGLGINSGQAGRLGLAVILPGGTTFAVGTQQVVQVTFQAVLVSSNVTTLISFGPLPAPPGISDTNGNSLPAAYVAGTLTIVPTSMEGDVWPVGNEDYKVTINDWVQEGRFVAGVDTITNASEFQRADCAPRDTLGDGLITVADWVQVGRYYLGLDPPTAAGGPTGPPPGYVWMGNAAMGKVSAAGVPTGQPPVSIKPQDGTPRTISITPLTQGATADTVEVQLVAQGDESALQFSLAFDPTVISFVSASLAGGASGATMFVNTTNSARGQLGVALALLGPTFAAGTQEIVKLNFSSVSYTNATTLLTFADSPIIRQVADASTDVVSATYQNGSVQVGAVAWPQLAIRQSAGGITLTWPYSPTVLAAQWSANLGPNWTNTGGTPVTNGATVYLTLPAPTNTTFYRLAQP
ncbi:MAG: immunoglobulin domain-containing protein [Verrucomicrobiota bacterium]|jgi:hypothetical protein